MNIDSTTNNLILHYIINIITVIVSTQQIFATMQMSVQEIS